MAAAALVVGHRCRRRCTHVNHAKTQQVHRDNTEYLGKKGRGKGVKDTEREKQRQYSEGALSRSVLARCTDNGFKVTIMIYSLQGARIPLHCTDSSTLHRCCHHHHRHSCWKTAKWQRQVKNRALLELIGSQKRNRDRKMDRGEESACWARYREEHC